MRLYILTLLLFSIVSCENEQEKRKQYEREKLISDARVREMTDSLMQDYSKKALFDTVGLSSSPVKILSARLIKQDYSNYKDISLTFKNVSKQKIEGIRFRWYGLNTFGEPADMGGYGLVEGFGGGFDDDPLGAGKTRTSQWSILSKDGKKVVLAWPIEVVFADGTKWKCGE